jgi:hypothetical protein
VRAEEERKARKEAIKKQIASGRLDKRFSLALNVGKNCTQNFKSQTREKREHLLSKLDSQGIDAPEIGKYNPKLETLRR